MTSKHIAKSDSKAMFPSDADTMVQSTGHGPGESQMDDNFETLSDISSSDLRRNLLLNINSLPDICGALNDEVSVSSWKHSEELPYLDASDGERVFFLQCRAYHSQKARTEMKRCETCGNATLKLSRVVLQEIVPNYIRRHIQ